MTPSPFTFLLAQLTFSNGVFFGLCDVFDNNRNQGSLSFSYKRHLSISSYHISQFSQTDISHIRAAFQHYFSTHLAPIISVRESYPFPIHTTIHQIEDLPGKERELIVTFSIQNIKNTFQANLCLKPNGWIYSLSSKEGPLSRHKSCFHWEDLVLKALIQTLSEIPAYQLAFSIYYVHYKFK